MSKPISIYDVMKPIQEMAVYHGRDLSLKGCSSLNRLGNNEISFYSGRNMEEVFKVATDNNVIVCLNLFDAGRIGNYIMTDNPRYVFAVIASMFCNKPKETKFGRNFIAGKNCSIKNAIIGDNVTLHSGVRIGEDGFGYVRKDAGSPVIKFPHFCGVIIEDNVEIHSNVCIDRGSLSDTIIHKNVKIDNLVHIAHNVEVGEGTLIMAGSVIGGSTKIGKNCWISPGCQIIDGIIIPDFTKIGMGAAVIKSIDGDSQVWAGVPARRIIRRNDVIRS